MTDDGPIVTPDDGDEWEPLTWGFEGTPPPKVRTWHRYWVDDAW